MRRVAPKGGSRAAPRAGPRSCAGWRPGKYGTETANLLAGRLATITDPECVGEIGRWLLRCEDEGELLARVARLCFDVARRRPPAKYSREVAYKLFFSFPQMVHDLLSGFVPGDWVRDLHLSTLEPWPEGHASDDFGRRRRDRMWRVRLRDHWLCVPVLLEFQPTMDWTIAVRILVNDALLYRNLLRDEPHDPLSAGAPPRGLPRCRAVERPDGCGGARGAARRASRPVPVFATLLRARRRRLLRPPARGRPSGGDADSPGAQPRPVGGPGGDEDDVPGAGPAGARIRGVDAVVPGDDGAGALSDAPYGTPVAAAEELEEGGDRIRGGGEELGGGVAPVRPDRRSSTRAMPKDGSRVSPRAGPSSCSGWRPRKYGAETAERLGGKLAEIADAERTVEVGEWLLECEDGGELLERVERLCASPGAAGDDPSPG